MPRYSTKEELGLIDHNINTKELEPFWCEVCKSKLLYQKGAPPPQCPKCFASSGLLVSMKKYFFVSQ